MIRYCDPVFYDKKRTRAPVGPGSIGPGVTPGVIGPGVTPEVAPGITPGVTPGAVARLVRKQLDHEKERRSMRNASETNDGANVSANGGGHLGEALAGAFSAHDGSFFVRLRPPERLWLLRAKPKELTVSRARPGGLGSFPEPFVRELWPRYAVLDRP